MELVLYTFSSVKFTEIRSFYFCKILSFCLLIQNSDHITHHHEIRVKKARAVNKKNKKKIKPSVSQKVLLAWILIAWNLHCPAGCK